MIQQPENVFATPDIQELTAIQRLIYAPASHVPGTGHAQTVFVHAIQIIMVMIVPFCVAKVGLIKTANVPVARYFV